MFEKSAVFFQIVVQLSAMSVVGIAYHRLRRCAEGAPLPAGASDRVSIMEWNWSFIRLKKEVRQNKLCHEAKLQVERVHSLWTSPERDLDQIGPSLMILKTLVDTEKISGDSQCNAAALKTFLRLQFLYRHNLTSLQNGFVTMTWNNYILFRFGLGIKEIVGFKSRLRHGLVGRSLVNADGTSASGIADVTVPVKRPGTPKFQTDRSCGAPSGPVVPRSSSQSSAPLETPRPSKLPADRSCGAPSGPVVPRSSSQSSAPPKRLKVNLRLLRDRRRAGSLKARKFLRVQHAARSADRAELPKRSCSRWAVGMGARVAAPPPPPERPAAAAPPPPERPASAAVSPPPPPERPASAAVSPPPPPPPPASALKLPGSVAAAPCPKELSAEPSQKKAAAPGAPEERSQRAATAQPKAPGAAAAPQLKREPSAAPKRPSSSATEASGVREAPQDSKKSEGGVKHWEKLVPQPSPSSAEVRARPSQTERKPRSELQGEPRSSDATAERMPHISRLLGVRSSAQAEQEQRPVPQLKRSPSSAPEKVAAGVPPQKRLRLAESAVTLPLLTARPSEHREPAETPPCHSRSNQQSPVAGVPENFACGFCLSSYTRGPRQRWLNTHCFCGFCGECVGMRTGTNMKILEYVHCPTCLSPPPHTFRLDIEFSRACGAAAPNAAAGRRQAAQPAHVAES